jgi:predicted DNA-binding transcriptional regulator AlpA
MSTPNAHTDELWSAKQVCKFFDIHISTLYRHKGGRYPMPAMQGSTHARWLRSECEAARQRILDPEARLAAAEAVAERHRRAADKRAALRHRKAARNG